MGIVEYIRMRKSTVVLAGCLWFVVAACSGATSDPLVSDPAPIPESSATVDQAGSSTDGSTQTEGLEAPDSVDSDSESDAAESGSAESGDPGSDQQAIPGPIPISDSAPLGTFIRLEAEVIPLIDSVVSPLDRPSGPAFADGLGGLVFQPPWGVDQTVFYLAPNSTVPTPLLDVAGDREMRLWGADNIEGRPRLMATVVDRVGSEDEVTTLLRWDKGNKSEWIAELGGPDTTIDAVDHGQNRFVADVTTSEGSSFVFLDGAGGVDELASNPKPLCKAAPDCRRLPALSPGGGYFAYYDPVSREVTVIELDLAEDIGGFAIPAESEVTSIDLSETDLVINHSVDEVSQAAFVVDLTSDRPRLEQLPVPGDAYLGAS